MRFSHALRWSQPSPTITAKLLKSPTCTGRQRPDGESAGLESSCDFSCLWVPLEAQGSVGPERLQRLAPKVHAVGVTSPRSPKAITG